MNILVSACLMGVSCRYDGKKQPVSESVLKLMLKHHLIPVCPEVFGGLSTPRKPCERVKNKVLTADGENYTEQYNKGAAQCLYLKELYKCDYALLKSLSPSCGYKTIYDGTFSGNLHEGNGVAADLLSKNGTRIFNENQAEILLKLL